MDIKEELSAEDRVIKTQEVLIAMAKDKSLWMYSFSGSIFILAGVYIPVAAAGLLFKIPFLFDTLPFLNDPTAAYLIGLILILVGVEVGVKFKHLGKI